MLMGPPPRFTRTAALSLFAALTLASAALAQDKQNVEVRVQPGVMVVADDNGEIIFDGPPMDGDGPMMLIGGPGGMTDMIGGALSGGGGAYTFPISVQELERYCRILRFTRDQTTAGTTLLDGSSAAFKTKADEVKKKIDDIREAAKENEEKDWWQKTMPITKELRQERDKAEESFLTDFRSIATKEQASRWDRVEMYRRRAKAMRSFSPFGTTGERVDLTAIVDSLKLDDALTAKLEPVLDSYERDVDVRIKEQADAQTKQRDAMKEAMKSHDFSAVTKAESERYDAGVKMRDTHRAFAAQIAAALPKEAAAKFDAAFHKAVYPKVYRERYAGKAIAAAEGLDDLKSDQRKAVEALKTRYTQATDDLNRRVETATIAAEQAAHDKEKTEHASGGDGQMVFRRTMKMEDDPQAASQRAERKELEDSTVKALLEILTPEQAERLPARPGSLVQDESGPKVKTKTP